MTTSEERLRERLAVLEKQIVSRRETLDRIKDLLDKADVRAASTDNKRRWNHVLDDLESALDEAKTRLLRAELDAQRVRDRLEDMRAGRASGATAADVTEGGEGSLVEEQILTMLATGMSLDELTPESFARFDLPPDSREKADRVLAIPVDEISRMSLEDVERLHNELAASRGAGIEKTVVRKRVTPLPETRRRLLDSGADKTGRGFADKLRQKTLRDALDKIRSNRMDALTLDEIDAALISYERLVADLRARSSQDNPAAEESLSKFEERYADLRRRRAQLYARRR
ncbi:MAG TPA: hypothetical protein PLO37_13540 [Candidatus Hydrogenedentes bacterium]|nr:hypothetical protein [Candidatus Hydrogenedentota bacterium]HPG67867.1 hypothetical protein [Candidatus Hydrogenedentota bacterium]